jgi:hypothetical protein
MAVSDVKKPLCQRCRERESVTVCGLHGVFLCLPCCYAHSGLDCFWNAAPAAFLVSKGEQLPLLLGVEGFDL